MPIGDGLHPGASNVLKGSHVRLPDLQWMISRPAASSAWHAPAMEKSALRLERCDPCQQSP